MIFLFYESEINIEQIQLSLIQTQASLSEFEISKLVKREGEQDVKKYRSRRKKITNEEKKFPRLKQKRIIQYLVLFM